MLLCFDALSAISTAIEEAKIREKALNHLEEITCCSYCCLGLTERLYIRSAWFPHCNTLQLGKNSGLFEALNHSKYSASLSCTKEKMAEHLNNIIKELPKKYLFNIFCLLPRHGQMACSELKDDKEKCLFGRNSFLCW